MRGANRNKKKHGGCKITSTALRPPYWWCSVPAQKPRLLAFENKHAVTDLLTRNHVEWSLNKGCVLNPSHGKLTLLSSANVRVIAHTLDRRSDWSSIAPRTRTCQNQPIRRLFDDILAKATLIGVGVLWFRSTSTRVHLKVGLGYVR